MTKRLSDPVAWSNVLLTVGGTLAVALLSAWGKTIYSAKLDTPRFVIDSINRTHDAADLKALVLRIDSTTQKIEARIK